MKTGYESLAWPIHKIMTMTLYYFFSREIADLSGNGQLKIIVILPITASMLIVLILITLLPKIVLWFPGLFT